MCLREDPRKERKEVRHMNGMNGRNRPARARVAERRPDEVVMPVFGTVLVLRRAGPGRPWTVTEA